MQNELEDFKTATGGASKPDGRLVVSACVRCRRVGLDRDHREPRGSHIVTSAACSDHFCSAESVEDQGDPIIVQLDFDLDGGLELKWALMAAGYDARRGSAGLDPAGELTAMFLQENRNDPVLVERLRRLKAMHPHLQSIIVTGLSSERPRNAANTEPCDSKLEALRASGFGFLTLEIA